MLTLNRPEARNALNAEVLRLLRLVAAEAGADETVRAVVITGAGERAFCAGADIRGMSEMSAAGAREWAGLGHAVFRSLELLPKPVIAAVNGTAVGGGLELALACDLRVLAESARLGQPEIKLGMIPGWGGTQRLPRLAGMTLAREMVLTGELVGAEQALRAGLVNRVVPAPDVLPTALDPRGALQRPPAPGPRPTPSRPSWGARRAPWRAPWPSRSTCSCGPSPPPTAPRDWRPSWRSAPRPSRDDERCPAPPLPPRALSAS